MPRKKIEGVCSVVDCGKPLRSGGLCANHYSRQWKYGRIEKAYSGDKRSHPLYSVWWDRKSYGSLGPEWQDFWKFVSDVSPRPAGRYFLVRLRDAPYGPDNFKWQAHLKRQDGETRKDWWARKRQARLANIPAMERIRDLKRRFGLTPDDYQAMVDAQRGVCAICHKEETSFEPKTGTRKNLAIDHCHKSGKIRGLLCWHCNSVLGKVEDSIPRLKAMIAYLRKHE